MKLKSFGCSFIFGSDLGDAGTGKINPMPSQKTWPALLANYLDYPYECFARPGAGNLQILDNILTQIFDPDPALYVISWSWIDRFDYWTDQPNWISNNFGKNCWHTIRPGSNDELAQIYYKQLHHTYSDKLNTLLYSKVAVDILLQNKLPFIMTFMDDLMFETEWHANHAVKDLQNYVKPYMTLFDDQTFLKWSDSRGYPTSETWHPLEQAHLAAADHLINSFDIQKIVGPVQPARA